MRHGNWFARLARVAAGLLAALGLLVLLVTFTPFVVWYGGKLAGPWQWHAGEVLIVLQGDVVDFGSRVVIGPGTYWRSMGAVEAFRRAPFREVVVSGGEGAAAMRDFLISQGIPAQAVRLQAESRSTREDAVQLSRMLSGAPGRKVLVTSDYHMFRASRALARAGLAVAGWPVPDARKGDWRARWPAFLVEMEETAKIVYYWARGWI